MGCGSSSGGSEPGDEKINWNNAEIDDEFKEEDNNVNGKRKIFDKKSGKAVDRGSPKADREFDFFEAAEAGEGDQFMATRPYMGAIQEPEEHNDESTDVPDVDYQLEYVYGYRAEDSRMNCFYNKDGHIVYFTAALGVILDQGSNTQKFFGGGQTDNSSKKVARDEVGHTNDITSMDVSGCGGLAATGQNGSRPVAFVWDSTTGEKKARLKLDKGMREVTAIAISPCGKLVALTDNNNGHHLWVFDIESQAKVKKVKSGPDRIYHVGWSKKEGDSLIALAGSKHYSVWDMNDSFKKRKGIHGDNGKPTSHCCVTWDDQGIAYTGGANSHIYMWEGRNLKGTYDVHGRGFVCAIRYVDGKIVSGAKDGKVVISNPAEKTAERTIDVDSLVRSVDMRGSSIVAGLRCGAIIEINSSDKITEVMRSHSDGEAWGLDISGDNIITSGDDNKIYTWSLKNRKNTATQEICDEDKSSKKGGASSMTKYAASKCARAVAINGGGNGHVAVAHNDGRVTIRGGIDNLGNIAHTLDESDEWIEALAYSPCGGKLAVGSHDDTVYVYNTEDYKLIGKGTAHNSFLVSVDWSEDSTYLRTVCGAHELLFFKVGDDVEQDPSGASNTKATKWHTSHAKYGWSVSGIFPSGTDGTHINDVDFSSCGGFITTGDDYGLVNVWRNPATIGAKPISLRGHSEHVVRTRFAEGNSYIISIGGYDKTIMQWKKM